MENNSIEFCKVKTNEKIKAYTSFRIGGRCNTIIMPENPKGIKNAIQFAVKNNLKWTIIGNGTNILFPDELSYDIVIRICEPYLSSIEFIPEMHLFRVEAGTLISKFLEFTVRKSSGGAEFLAGIPGTIGGAIIMNAGAQGKYIGDIIKSITVMNSNYEINVVSKEEAEFKYRDSRFKRNKEIILSAEIGLKFRDSEEIKSEIDELLKYRESKLPLSLPSAGCIFKNPPSGSAAYFIELSGCKGLKIGGAQVSTKHTNFIVNLGEATYEDVKAIIDEVQSKVYDEFKIFLETEIIVL